jgi:hypothetical protein
VIGGPDTGIWLLLVGWFVFQTARSEATDLKRAAQTIDPDAISVADLAPLDPPVVEETATVDDLIAMSALPSKAWPWTRCTASSPWRLRSMSSCSSARWPTWSTTR